MKLSTGTKKLDWIFTQIIYWALTIAAVGIPSTVALVILATIIVFSTLCFLFIATVKLICIKLYIELPNNSLNQLDYPLPKWIAIGSDVLISTILLATGHWVVAIQIAIAIYLEYKAITLKVPEPRCPCSSANRAVSS
jgi:hypothetical protein